MASYIDGGYIYTAFGLVATALIYDVRWIREASTLVSVSQTLWTLPVM
ncbi:hypothetical protein [Lawsonibacter sp. OA9]|nr:hypothetical protein [Lawsonibacter sp. OA9]MBS5590746.1 hypothetical protein [Clostridiales bacterium]